MNDTPRTDQQNHELLNADSYTAWLEMSAFARQLERELTAANQRIKQLENALDCVVVSCSYLNHEKKHQHEYNKPCPVEQLIRKAKESKP